MSQETEMKLWQEIERLKRQVERLKVGEVGGWVYLTTPLTSTSWDGDSFSTTGKTKIDLSSEFGVPAGVKAVLLFLAIRDSDSAAKDCWVIVSPNDTDSSGLAMSCMTVNDRYQRGVLISPCDANGDIYFQCAASGSGTLDVHLQIWGYWL